MLSNASGLSASAQYLHKKCPTCREAHRAFSLFGRLMVEEVLLLRSNTTRNRCILRHDLNASLKPESECVQNQSEF